MDIFLLFLPRKKSSETTRGFISQTSSCRARRAGGNSLQMSSVLLKRSPAVDKTACSPQPGHTQPRPGCAPKNRAPALLPRGCRRAHGARAHGAGERARAAPGVAGRMPGSFGKPGLTQPRLRPRGAALAPPAPLWGLEPPLPPRGAPRAQPPPATGGGSGCRSGAV